MHFSIYVYLNYIILLCVRLKVYILSRTQQPASASFRQAEQTGVQENRSERPLKSMFFHQSLPVLPAESVLLQLFSIRILSKQQPYRPAALILSMMQDTEKVLSQNPIPVSDSYSSICGMYP